MPDSLRTEATASPDQLFRVIIQGRAAVPAADGGPAPFMPDPLRTGARAPPDQLSRVTTRGRAAVPTPRAAGGVSQARAAAPAYGGGVDIKYSAINAVSAEMSGEQLL